MRKWKVKGGVYSFPKLWGIDEVVRFVNTDIKYCDTCKKVDVGIDHFEKCNPKQEFERQLNNTYYK